MNQRVLAALLVWLFLVSNSAPLSAAPAPASPGSGLDPAVLSAPDEGSVSRAIRRALSDAPLGFIPEVDSFPEAAHLPALWGKGPGPILSGSGVRLAQAQNVELWLRSAAPPML